MNTTEARALAISLMTEHGLSDRGWHFEFDTAKRRYGATHYGLKRITLSKALVELNEVDSVKDTILHEIAHGLAGAGAGHGYMWRHFATTIGCNGKRTYSASDTVITQRTFRGECPGCHRKIERFKRMKIACGRCCKTHNHNRFDAQYLFIWERI